MAKSTAKSKARRAARKSKRKPARRAARKARKTKKAAKRKPAAKKKKKTAAKKRKPAARKRKSKPTRKAAAKRKSKSVKKRVLTRKKRTPKKGSAKKSPSKKKSTVKKSKMTTPTPESKSFKRLSLGFSTAGAKSRASSAASSPVLGKKSLDFSKIRYSLPKNQVKKSYDQCKHFINTILAAPCPHKIERIWGVRDELGVSLLIQCNKKQSREAELWHNNVMCGRNKLHFLFPLDWPVKVTSPEYPDFKSAIPALVDNAIKVWPAEKDLAERRDELVAIYSRWAHGIRKWSECYAHMGYKPSSGHWNGLQWDIKFCEYRLLGLGKTFGKPGVDEDSFMVQPMVLRENPKTAPEATIPQEIKKLLVPLYDRRENELDEKLLHEMFKMKTAGIPKSMRLSTGSMKATPKK